MKKKLKEEFLPFHQNPNVDSLTSFGKSKSLGAVPTENQTLIGTLEAKNPSPSGIFKCFKLGEPFLELKVGGKAYEPVLDALFVKEVKEPSCNDDYEYTNVPIFDEYPNENFGGDFEDVPVFAEYPNEFNIDSEEGRLADIVKESFLGLDKIVRKFWRKVMEKREVVTLRLKIAPQDLTFKLPLVFCCTEDMPNGLLIQSMAAVDVYKKKLMLKIGCDEGDMDQGSHMPTSELHNK
ncbi:hypothetical protein RHMOL_Rhmol04G0001000 [Rhododendron molle]|uniref:Uncharacterized protein n=1 Tax=Rhododendron molle TaxID=49168 RepID=A0ACC0NVH5_RHOML|nr:hypothetical protein RHMOL_Rhmol04G0001000 [Rhododendron molle]